MPVVFICFYGYTALCTSETLDCYALTTHILLYYSDLINLLSVALNMYSPVPIYIRHADLGNTKGKNITLDLCKTCETHVAGQVLGAQWTNVIWSFWFKTEKARAYLVDKVKTLIMYKQNVEMHGNYPMSKHVPNEKITFKDMPIDVSDKDITDYLKSHNGIVIKSGVIHGRIRNDKNNVLTQFLSGDRFVFVKGNFSPVLPSSANLNSIRCRIWHTPQKHACIRCRHTSHSTSETEKCEAFTNDQEVVIIKSPKYPMCNYYPSRMKMHGIDFPSSEHAYQWRFLKYIGQHDLAEEAIKAPSPAEAKAVAARVPKHLHKYWHLIKKSIMKEILHIKADFCAYFKQSLLDIASSRLVEAVQGGLYWSSGLPPYLAATTKSQFYPGRNELGSILESVRFDIMKEAVLSQTYNNNI